MTQNQQKLMCLKMRYAVYHQKKGSSKRNIAVLSHQGFETTPNLTAKTLNLDPGWWFQPSEKYESQLG